jgi:hypothetical protein
MTKKSEVPSGRQNRVCLLVLLSSLTGLEYSNETTFPALKRWASVRGTDAKHNLARPQVGKMGRAEARPSDGKMTRRGESLRARIVVACD